MVLFATLALSDRLGEAIFSKKMYLNTLIGIIYWNLDPHTLKIYTNAYSIAYIQIFI